MALARKTKSEEMSKEEACQAYEAFINKFMDEMDLCKEQLHYFQKMMFDPSSERTVASHPDLLTFDLFNDQDPSQIELLQEDKDVDTKTVTYQRKKKKMLTQRRSRTNARRKIRLVKRRWTSFPPKKFITH
ncbi:hypothetical protein MUA33_09125 [Staphylococcus delphini]|uniref:IS66 family transposase n=1 Tax=Staphylococcus delphini TaxID=53344 RepID=UPI0021D10971|nr:hypothetical protein [Staphylococcus delphini]UXS30534.1 hypothetical protein MUA33_09125 [Staphylococcus delphini]